MSPKNRILVLLIALFNVSLEGHAGKLADAVSPESKLGLLIAIRDANLGSEDVQDDIFHAMKKAIELNAEESLMELMQVWTFHPGRWSELLLSAHPEDYYLLSKALAVYHFGVNQEL